MLNLDTYYHGGTVGFVNVINVGARRLQFSFAVAAVVVFCVAFSLYRFSISSAGFLAFYALLPGLLSSIVLNFVFWSREVLQWIVSIASLLVVLGVCEVIYNTWGEWWTPGDYLGYLLFGVPVLVLAIVIRLLIGVLPSRQK